MHAKDAKSPAAPIVSLPDKLVDVPGKVQGGDPDEDEGTLSVWRSTPTRLNSSIEIDAAAAERAPEPEVTRKAIKFPPVKGADSATRGRHATNTLGIRRPKDGECCRGDITTVRAFRQPPPSTG